MADTSESNSPNRSKIKNTASDWDDPVLLTFKNAVLYVLKLIYEKDTPTAIFILKYFSNNYFSHFDTFFGNKTSISYKKKQYLLFSMYEHIHRAEISLSFNNTHTKNKLHF